MLRIYNTLTKRVESFEPLEPPTVKMYVCGPTVYDYSHLGHARTYVFFDSFYRYLKKLGYHVLYIQNITDIDDKIIRRSIEEGRSSKEVADEFLEEYMKDMDALGIKRALHYPRVTEHIEDIIKVIEGIIKNGYAYESNGNVYFSVEKFKDYGMLSGQSLDEIKVGARVETDPNKRSPVDFALWKKSKEGEPYWESPWGKGRPGWHIECSTLSMKYLGCTIDVHGGGQDLIFPHHENEIAQSRAYCKTKIFAKYWIHTGLLKVEGEKMSKSLGNFITVRETLKRYDKGSIRLLLLSAHYRKPLDFTWEKLDKARKSLERYLNVMEELRSRFTEGDSHANGTSSKLEGEDLMLYRDIVKYGGEIRRSLNDDFNTANAIAAAFSFIRKLNKYLRESNVKHEGLFFNAYEILAYLGDILGIYEERAIGGRDEMLREVVGAILKVREEMRRAKKYEVADEIRDALKSVGIAVEDTKEGTTWKILR
ncbi:MAG: cysteine--tRNA ligase [Candidatus Odinarchaeota archaeon]|nr:cysteine--tRNA ligase [Candidatus Odinarchaeota archaeon]